MKKLLLTSVMAIFISATYSQSNENLNLREQITILMKMEDSSFKEQKLEVFSNSPIENENLIAYYYYISKKEEGKSSKLRDKIIRKFPQGELVLKERIESILKIESLDQKELEYNKLNQDYSDRTFGQLAQNLAQAYAIEGNVQKMVLYADIYGLGITDGKGNKISKARLYAPFAAAMIRSNPEGAIPFLKASVDEQKQDLDNILKEGGERSKRARSNYFASVNNYVRALTMGSNPENGYKLSHELYQNLKKDTSVDERALSLVENGYVNTLLATKRFKESQPIIEKLIKNGLANENLQKSLKPVYIEINGSDEGYTSYEQKILASQNELFVKEIEKKAINLPAHDFELRDVDGNTVQLSSYKGKVVVLDFWATWCGPCKASFPSMQKAVNKYKNDPNVEFLFLHTWEKGSGDPIKNAKKYITDNNYTFKVLMDLRDPSTKISAVASKYNVDGIPTKIIIDTQGKIRFETSGFSSQEDLAVKELSTMIEIAKTNGK